MQSGSYWAYREAGAFCEEPDEDWPAERRDRCTCGAFLRKKPNFEGGLVTEQRDYGDEHPETGEWMPDVVTERVWYEPETACGRCGKIWTEAELWR